MVWTKLCYVLKVLTVEGTANELQEEESFDHIWVLQEISQYANCATLAFPAKVVQNSAARPEADAAYYQTQQYR